MARLVERDKADRSFNLDFWEKVGAQRYFKTAWQMVLEVEAIKGGKPEHLKMNRSVQNIIRKKVNLKIHTFLGEVKLAN